jgi:hypothetical protein
LDWVDLLIAPWSSSQAAAWSGRFAATSPHWGVTALVDFIPQRPRDGSAIEVAPSYGIVIGGVQSDNAASVVVRFVSLVTPTSFSGTNRIDNIAVNGSLIPAPGAVVLAGLAALVTSRRRR